MIETGSPLTLPIIHLNGSSAKTMLEDNRKAANALYDAREALVHTAPHPRDYYVSQDEDAYEKARNEHFARLKRIQDVMDELDTIARHLIDNIKN